MGNAFFLNREERVFLKRANESCGTSIRTEEKTTVFVKADLDREKEELNKLASENGDAKRAYDEFQARIALQRLLVQTRKAENMTQTDVANAAGLSQQAVSRIEKGTGATVASLLKYLTGIGYGIELKKSNL